ncbi:hypothetical protein [Delftia acidovorans]|uniref:Uncharacterized protein n=1 Tax=Delftia acidovorans TaxID=80866 RepID=A0AAJ2R7D9_DELAC|nr:hypothetical protein [Delftia acidovorans]MDX4957283.1 hypothetical protein [Delftia acidovorans]
MTTAPTPDLRALAEAAKGNGEHIYTHPIDSNKWRENEAWHRAASPGAVLHLLDRIQELEGKLGRFQGVPLPLIEAINAATGSNDWQGDHSPAELLEPACRAITALRAERPMPTVEDASQEWGKVDPITAWHLIERHADNWADIGKMMTEYVQAQIALAELEARKPLPLSDEQIEKLREQAFSTNNPFCPCDSKTMRKAVRAAERAHGITGGSS